MRDIDPFEEMRKMHREMDRMFRQFFNKPLIGTSKDLISYERPLSDIEENKDFITLNIDMPGIKKEDIQLNITDDMIEVKAERKHESKVEKKGFFQQERSYSGFYRRLPLPANVKADQANAEYKNGVLSITIPREKKVIENKKVKRIPIKWGK